MTTQEQQPLTQLNYHQKRLAEKSLQLERTKGKESTSHFSHNQSAGVKGKRGIKSWILAIKLLYQALKLLLS